jgi:hypothetical protein
MATSEPPPDRAPCSVCGEPAIVTCDERGVNLCPSCITPAGRLGGLEHPMPGRETICAHRRADSLAARLSGRGTALYHAGPP